MALCGLRLLTPDLDPFQADFRSGFGMETALVSLLDDLHQGPEGRSATLLILLEHSVVFDTIDHGVLLGWLAMLGALFCSGFTPA